MAAGYVVNQERSILQLEKTLKNTRVAQDNNTERQEWVDLSREARRVGTAGLETD
ncbi:hypothetical protein [Polycladidibacter stylochi]|uniref:hypothetical protein n=1 Tax=Polycladidibacter stylochi TaxID=1807766 RepID=UPI000ACF40A8|nr:hypothetical protein [Pseudovibrio stylochi]